MAIYRPQLRYHSVGSYDKDMAHADLEALLDILLPFAQTMLSKNGEFYPFGATMSSNGEITQVAAGVEGDDHPPSQPLIDLLLETFQQQAEKGQLRATGICYDVLTVPPGQKHKTDAICCSFEHCLGESVDVFIPYAKEPDGNVHSGEIFAVKRAARVFCNLRSCD